MRSNRQVGTNNRRLSRHKTGKAIWSYEDGSLTQAINGQVHTLSACDTLALTNLLYSNYSEIVTKARSEQRAREHKKFYNILDTLCEHKT